MSLGSLSSNGGGSGSGGGGGGAPTGAAGGDLGGSYPNPTVLSGSNLGSKSVPIAALANDGTVDGKFLKSVAGIWVPTSAAYTDLTGVPTAFTPSAHHTSHESGGSDPVALAASQVTGTAVITTDARLSDTRTPTDLSVTDAKVAVAAAIAPTKISGTAVITTDSRLSDARTPAAHGASHDLTGSDPIHDLARVTGHPGALGYLAWVFDSAAASSQIIPTAGQIFLAKILTSSAFTISELDIYIQQGGSGATALANCFLAIYDSSGTRRFLSADQSTVWNTSGIKSVTGVGYTVTASSYIYIAFLIGTQSTTACTIARSPNTNTAHHEGALSAAAWRAATNLTGQTTLPASLTLSSNVAGGNLLWAGVL